MINESAVNETGSLHAEWCLLVARVSVSDIMVCSAAHALYGDSGIERREPQKLRDNESECRANLGLDLWRFAGIERIYLTGNMTIMF